MIMGEGGSSKLRAKYHHHYVIIPYHLFMLLTLSGQPNMAICMHV